MKNFLLVLTSIFSLSLYGQDATIKGKLVTADNEPVIYANIALYSAADSSMVKVESTDVDGNFQFRNVTPAIYFASASYIGLNELSINEISVTGVGLDLGSLTMDAASIELETAIVTAKRSLVEVKADRTVFNVEGTINSVGDNALGLLRKAPSVLVDNNENVTVLGRSGVLLYVDGKRIPLAGAELSGYLQNITSDQIDRIDIITNPGAKYEAQGNAGIIDIRLKKDKNLGFNGSLDGTLTKGDNYRGAAGIKGNFRNKAFNTFGGLNYNGGNQLTQLHFVNYQNGAVTIEDSKILNIRKQSSYRWGTDFFVGKNTTIGFLVDGAINDADKNLTSDLRISVLGDTMVIDSVLFADNTEDGINYRSTYNVNYNFDNKNTNVNMDLDYGRYRNDSDNIQPNKYYDGTKTNLLREVNTASETPVSIDIYTMKLDYEKEALGGRIGLGTKFSKVKSDNEFLFYDVPANERILNTKRSNRFTYDENVMAGYASFAAKLNDKTSYSIGLRAEQTNATGDLNAFEVGLQEPPVVQDYLSFFPSAGLSYQLAPQHSLALNYGRRINRPNYQVLNPFKLQLNELSFFTGNPRLKPEIVNNYEIGYTYAYRYNFKLAYSRTIDQITRLIGASEDNPLAGFLSWDNLASQDLFSLNMSLPFQVTDKWGAYINLSGSYIDNQADYGDGLVVDVQALSYSIFQQHTYKLPKGFNAEISGYFAGPGIWGGVFEYETSWSLNLGLQKKFLGEKLNVKVSAQDLFYQAGWSGVSKFGALEGEGMGNWESRYVSLSMNYRFGNSKVKSRKRKIGSEAESKRTKKSS